MQINFDEKFDCLQIVGEQVEMQYLTQALLHCALVLEETSKSYTYYALRFSQSLVLNQLCDDFFNDPVVTVRPSGIDPNDYDGDDIHEMNTLYISEIEPILLFFVAIGSQKAMSTLKESYCGHHGYDKDNYWDGDALVYAFDKAQIDAFCTSMFMALREIPSLKSEVGSLYEQMVLSRETYKQIDMRLLLHINYDYGKASKTKRKKNLKDWLNQLIHVDVKYKNRSQAIRFNQYFAMKAQQMEQDFQSQADDQLNAEYYDKNEFKDFAA